MTTVYGLTCDEASTALLLATDDVSVRRARRHQDTCEQCGVREAPTPEIEERLMAALPVPAPWMRLALMVLGLAQLAVSLPWLVGTDPLQLLGDGASVAHQTRDGAFGFIVGVSAMVAVWRFRFAMPAFVVASAALIAETAASLFDNSLTATGSNELIHLVSVGVTSFTGALAIRFASLGPERLASLRSVVDQDVR